MRLSRDGGSNFIGDVGATNYISPNSPTLGLIYKFKIIKWLLPSPIYIDFSIQYIYVFSIALIFSSLDNLKKLYLSIILFSLVIIKSANYYKIFLSKDNLVPTGSFPSSKRNLAKSPKKCSHQALRLN